MIQIRTDFAPPLCTASLVGPVRFFRNIHLTEKLSLLAFAGHARVPIDERAIGIVAPGPDMQFVERLQAEPIRAVNKLKRLTLENRWSFMMGVPGGRIHNKLDTDKAHPAVQ